MEGSQTQKTVRQCRSELKPERPCPTQGGLRGSPRPRCHGYPRPPWRGRGDLPPTTSTPLSPAPRPRAHARTHALPVNGGSWKTLGPPGPARRLLLWCWRCSGGRAGVSRLESGRGSCGSSTARPATRGAARWPDLQGRAKGRRSARLLGRPEPTASGSGIF